MQQRKYFEFTCRPIVGGVTEYEMVCFIDDEFLSFYPTTVNLQTIFAEHDQLYCISCTVVD
jgi:hypothetical protein